jgi:hypothetical protein
MAVGLSDVLTHGTKQSVAALVHTCTITVDGTLKRAPTPHVDKCVPIQSAQIIFANTIGAIKTRVKSENISIQKIMTE